MMKKMMKKRWGDYASNLKIDVSLSLFKEYSGSICANHDYHERDYCSYNYKEEKKNEVDKDEMKVTTRYSQEA